MDYRNKTKIAPTARIARNATVIGDVSIGEDCTILFNATIRGDMGGKVIIGNRTNVQELACLHVPLNDDTVVGSDVTIGHGAIVHGCTIGDGTLIGMGAIVLDGARIGKNCLIGAGALVTGKSVIPDRMLVIGSPAKAVRELSDEEIDNLAVNVEEYVEAGKDLVAQNIIDEGKAANASLLEGESF